MRDNGINNNIKTVLFKDKRKKMKILRREIGNIKKELTSELKYSHMK